MMQPQTTVNPNWETQSYSSGTDSASFFDSASSACSSSGESAASRGGLATNLHTLGVADKIANRIDQGFNLEVRIEPSKDADGAAGSADAKKGEAIIQSATKNMQFLKLEGDRILKLTEKREGEEKPKKKPLGGRKIELEK